MVPENRRHRLIWLAVAGAHAALLGAVILGGLRSSAEVAREGGVLLVSLVAEPIALPGEVIQGVAVGAGAAQPAATPVPPARPVPVATIASSAPAAVAAPEIAAPGPSPVVAVPAPAAVPAVAEVFTPPSFRVHEEPAYPERARRAGVEGDVVVKVLLSARGEIRRVELARSSGSRLLDEAALAAARASQFSPAERNRVPVEAEATATYRFELR